LTSFDVFNILTIFNPFPPKNFPYSQGKPPKLDLPSLPRRRVNFGYS